MIENMLEKIVTLLSTNSEIITFCEDTYSKKQSIFLGIDTEDAPPSTYYPLIAILGITRDDRGHSSPTESFSVFISLVIESSTNVPSVIEGVTIVRYSGFKEIEQFREIVEDAILKNQWGDSWVPKVTGQTVTGSFSQFFETVININFTRSSYKRLGHGVR